MSKTVLTFVHNLELMQKDRTATLAWTLEVDEEETVLHKFTSKPELVTIFGRVSYRNIVHVTKKEKNGDLTPVILTSGPNGLCSAAKQAAESLKRLNTE